MKRLIIYIIAILVGIQMLPKYSFAQDQKPQNWLEINGLGLYDEDHTMGLPEDFWGNQDAQIVVNSLNQLPPILSHAAYRDIVKKMLLSEATIRNTGNSPQFLTKRINLLYSYGLFDEAEALFNKIPETYDLSQNPDTALLTIQNIIMEGGLAPACLDIQVLKNNFENDRRWIELSNFCQLRYASDKNFSIEEVQFNVYPALQNILLDDIDNINTIKPIEGLIAQSENRLFTDAFFNGNARNAEALSDLSVYFATDGKYADKPLYQCFIIEAADRGLRDTAFVEQAYTNKKFDNDALLDSSGEIKLHPCDVPAYFYQRLTRLKDGKVKSKTSEAFLGISDSYPAFALKPFAQFIDNTMNASVARWNAGIILNLNGRVDDGMYLPDIMPIYSIVNKEEISLNEYKEWLDRKVHEDLLGKLGIDIAAPLYVSSIFSGENNRLLKNNEKYEQNLPFSLTYENKSLNLGYGLNGFMSKMYREKDMFEVIITMLNLVGSKKIEDFSLNEATVILSTLRAYKLEKESVMLALEYLQ